MKLPKLYAKTKSGETKVYLCWTEGATIIREYGLEGGTMQRAETIAKPKNVGRSNETTAEEQADKEATAKWQKKKDKEYFEKSDQADTIQVVAPMLAGNYAKRMDKVSFPMYAQPKFDGVRCLAIWDGENYKLMSRGGKEYTAPSHIADDLKNLDIDRDLILDGEIYLHDTPLQDIMKLVKKYRDGDDGSVQLQYWIYDSFYLDKVEKWEDRLPRLNSLPVGQHNRITATKIVNDASEVEQAHGTYVVDGYEGAILRAGHGTYEIAKRSLDLLKYKHFQDAEFKIVGYTEGKGKYTGCVIWECENEEGLRFNVNPKGTLEQKAEWFRDGDKYIGSQLTVQFQDRTNDNIPTFPVGIAIRIPEDQPVV